MKIDNIIIVGYSGHGFVAVDIFQRSGVTVTGYCENESKSLNPFRLNYLGREGELDDQYYLNHPFFIGIGHNGIRSRIFSVLSSKSSSFANAIHPGSVISAEVRIGRAVMVAAGACINPLAEIGDGVICNTNCTVEHECKVGDFAHLAPGAVLCGNVTIGKNSFIGANSVIRQGVTIGDNCMIGAGSVIIADVKDGTVIFGNPGKIQAVGTN